MVQRRDLETPRAAAIATILNPAPAGSLRSEEEAKDGRSERIRTFDPLVPNEVRYQAALHSDNAASGAGGL
jgi:hypothetical protein